MDKRKNLRLKAYDYSQTGGYFVTICTQHRECLFGRIVDGANLLNEFGRVVVATWNDLPNHISGIELDEFIVMPNHIHGIIFIVGAGSKPAQTGRASSMHAGAGLEPAPTGTGIKLPEIVRQLKTFSSRRINKMRKPSSFMWQRNYYEHIIRDEPSLNRIREYIANNPLKWDEDPENPGVVK